MEQTNGHGEAKKNELKALSFFFWAICVATAELLSAPFN